MDWSKYLSPERVRTGKGSVGGADKRSPFESDYGRVLFSSAIRRMHDKTQVIPLTNGDAILTRLTHSIHVMNIAESLILNYTRSNQFCEENPDLEKRHELASALMAIARSAAFVHDVGNPPFGHFGEDVIQEYFSQHEHGQKSYSADSKDEKQIKRKALDFTQFDGNAQGFRILTRLQYIGALDGLNLTYATLAAYMKYPNPCAKDKSYIGTKKHGVFWSEEDVFNKMIDACQLRRDDGRIKRHPLSFIVEAADSIAYLTMDIEDAFGLKWFGMDALIKGLDHYIKVETGVSKSVIDIIGYKSRAYKEGKLIEGADRKAVVDFRVTMIQYLVNLAVSNFISHLDEIDVGSYSKELIEDDDNKVAKALTTFSQEYIYYRREICAEEITGRTVLIGLLDLLSYYAFHKDGKFRGRVKSAISRSRLEVSMHENSFPDEEYKFFSGLELYEYDIERMGSYGRWRMIVDFVSSMTDKYAVSLYQQLSGNKI